jgi:hypothetical protein
MMEAAMYHAKSNEIKGYRQGNEKHELRNFEPGRPLPFREFRIRIGRHLNSVRPYGGHGPPFIFLGFLPDTHE